MQTGEQRIQEMKQVEIQKRLRFRITKNGFLLDEQEGEFSEKILPWKEHIRRSRQQKMSIIL